MLVHFCYPFATALLIVYGFLEKSVLRLYMAHVTCKHETVPSLMMLRNLTHLAFLYMSLVKVKCIVSATSYLPSYHPKSRRNNNKYDGEAVEMVVYVVIILAPMDVNVALRLS